MFFISLLALFSSKWDFHMVCCCIKSNLTLLDQRLWWIPARYIHPSPFFSVLLGSKLDPQNWYVYLLNTEMFFPFFPFMNLWIALENLFYWNYFFPYIRAVIYDSQCHHVNLDNRKLRFNFHFRFSFYV